MLRIVTVRRLTELTEAKARSRSGFPLALYGHRNGNAFDLAAVYFFPFDLEPFWVIAGRDDGTDLVASFVGLEAARDLASNFIGSKSEIDWILGGSPLGAIRDAAAELNSAARRDTVRAARDEKTAVDRGIDSRAYLDGRG